MGVVPWLEDAPEDPVRGGGVPYCPWWGGPWGEQGVCPFDEPLRAGGRSRSGYHVVVPALEDCTPDLRPGVVTVCRWGGEVVVWGSEAGGAEGGQVLPLGPDGEVRFIGWVLPLQGNQHVGKGGGLSHDLLYLLLRVLGLAALQEQITLDFATSMGFVGHSEEPAKNLSELAEILACELRQVHHGLGGR